VSTDGVAPLLAFAGGVAATLGLREVGAVAIERLRARVPRLIAAMARLVETVMRVGREGHEPGTVERRRLLLAGAGIAFLGGTVLVGTSAGVALGIAGPWAVGRLLRARREHYRRAVDSAAGEVALALADALAAGHSLRGAVSEAAAGVDGQAGHELRRTRAELAAGAHTGQAFEALARRTGSPRLATLVAACLVQGGAGGDLATLLRESAAAFGDGSRLEDEVRTATAQARFTGLIVVLLPLGGAVLAELASPGFVAGLFGSWLTAWLVGLALVLQVGAAVAIRRIGRVRW
jgi:tight adherence protein B